MKIHPYLTFPGTCRDAFTFYEKVLGGTIVQIETHAGTPAAEHVPPEWQEKILHVHLTVGEFDLLGSDAPPQYQQPMQGFSVTLQVESAEEAERIFSAFAEGGSVMMPLEETFWAKKFAMVTDRFGTPWMISYS